MSVSRHAWRASNTSIVGVWSGATAADRDDLRRRVARLPHARYAARLFDGGDGSLVAAVNRPREFAASEAESVIELLQGATIPAEWQAGAKTNPCHGGKGGGRRKRNPPGSGPQVVRILLPKRHSSDPAGWARAHRYSPAFIDEEGSDWDLWMVDPFDLEPGAPTPWKTLSRAKGIRAMLGFPRRGVGVSRAADSSPAGGPATNPAGPVDWAAGRAALAELAAANEADDWDRALAALLLFCRGSGSEAHAAMMRAVLSAHQAVQCVESGQLDRAKSRIEAALAAWTTAEVAAANEAVKVNPSVPPASEAAAGVDEYEQFHWGQAPEDIQSVRRDALTPRGPLVGLGELFAVEYRTRKGKDRGPTIYRHTFGTPEGKEGFPWLAQDARRRLFVVGGGYTITERGIEG